MVFLHLHAQLVCFQQYTIEKVLNSTVQRGSVQDLVYKITPSRGMRLHVDTGYNVFQRVVGAVSGVCVQSQSIHDMLFLGLDYFK